MLTTNDDPVKMPGKPKRERVIAYIDGFNLYFGIKANNWRHYLWLNLVALSKNLCMDFQDLLEVKYFTSRISGPGPKQRRQSTYLDALGTLDNQVFKILYGKYQDEPQKCRLCGGEDKVSHEKMTDVNIAVEMMSDAYQDRFDAALLISADADLCPPVSSIRRLFPHKRVVVGFPPSRRSTELANVASNHFVVGKGSLARSQFPVRLETVSGMTLEKPETWVSKSETR
jgi:uncharacterized LabA/DUF88 family protein